MARVFTDSDNYSAIADAIRAKGVGGTFKPSEMPAAIASIESGGGGGTTAASVKGVNFRDYDGTVLYSYSVEETAALTELPALPSHDGLVCQGWNWTLADIQAMGRAVDIGAMYVTDDGATRLYIRLVAPVDLWGYVRFTDSIAGDAAIDWGDGTMEVSTSTSNTEYSHQYAAVGEYCISIKSTSGEITFIGSANSYNALGTYSSYNKRNVSKLVKIEFGSNVTSIKNLAFCSCPNLTNITIPNSLTSAGHYTFQNCYSLASVSIPNSLTSTGNYTFQNCYSLASVSMPNSLTSIGGNAFQNCYSLASVSMPNSLTSIGGIAFQNCYSLTSVSIPNSLTSIGGNAFQNCYSLTSVSIPNSLTSIEYSSFASCYSLASVSIPNSVAKLNSSGFGYSSGVMEYHLKRETPPTLSSTNVFSGIASGCIIYVPQGCLEAYQTATNWSTYASYMQEEP